MRDNFVKLMDFIFGKYMYTIMKNNDKVLYFEVVNNKYVQPISSFNLYDNEGKSLTSVNEHFFMNQLVNRINVACKKGIFISDQEIITFLSKIKACCGDSELKKLFKGTYMNEINEFNFEDNKRNIVRYLDKFKFDTFVDYNNVSVFNGSLEKNSDEVSTEPNIDILPVETMDIQNNVVQDSIENVVQNADINNSDDMEVVDIVDESANNNEISNVQQTDANSVGLDFMNIPVDNSTGDVVSSSDYFSNSQTVQNNEQAQPVENNVQSDLTAPLDFNSLYSNNSSAQEIAKTEVQDVQQEVQPQEVIQPVQEQSTEQIQENPALKPATSSVDLTAPLDFNSLYSNNSSAQEIAKTEVQDVQQAVQPQEVVQTVREQSTEQIQENPALKPATSSVDLTAPLDFNSLYSNNESEPIQDVSQENNDQSNIQMIPNSDFSAPTFDDVNNQNEFVNSVNINNQNEIVNNEQIVEDNSFHNDGFSLAEPLVENAVDSNLNNNNVMYSEQVSAPSYINEVKSRIEDNAFNTELGVMDPNVTESDLEKTVVVDRVNMPPLESLSDEKPKREKGKKSFGVIIFIIVLLLALAGFAYFLYNYIF